MVHKEIVAGSYRFVVPGVMVSLVRFVNTVAGDGVVCFSQATAIFEVRYASCLCWSRWMPGLSACSSWTICRILLCPLVN